MITIVKIQLLFVWPNAKGREFYDTLSENGKQKTSKESSNKKPAMRLFMRV
jgi:hypothetical protein